MPPPQSRCLVCDQILPTAIVFLRFHSTAYEGWRRVDRAHDVRCRCCRACRRRVVWSDRLRRFHLLLFVICAALLLGLYVLCVPLLLKMGVGRALVGVGFVVPGVISWLLTASIVRASAKELLAPQAVERLRAQSVPWKEGPEFFVSLTSEPAESYIKLDDADDS